MQNNGDFSVLDLFDNNNEVEQEPKPQTKDSEEEELEKAQKKWLWENSFHRVF